MDMTPWIILGVANIPTYVVFGWLFFGSWGDFWECVRFWITPDIISLFRGEYFEDQWAQLKLFIFLIVNAATVYAEHMLIAAYF